MSEGKDYPALVFSHKPEDLLQYMPLVVEAWNFMLSAEFTFAFQPFGEKYPGSSRTYGRAANAISL